MNNGDKVIITKSNDNEYITGMVGEIDGISNDYFYVRFSINPFPLAIRVSNMQYLYNSIAEIHCDFLRTQNLKKLLEVL